MSLDLILQPSQTVALCFFLKLTALEICEAIGGEDTCHPCTFTLIEPPTVKILSDDSINNENDFKPKTPI